MSPLLNPRQTTAAGAWRTRRSAAAAAGASGSSNAAAAPPPVATTTASASTGAPPDSDTRQPSPWRSMRSAAATIRRLPSCLLQRARQLLQPVGERHRLAEPAAAAPLLDRAAHHAAVRAFERRQPGQRARRRQLGGVAGVDADHRRRHQRARRLVAEAPRAERQHRLVAVGRAAAQERLAQQTQLAAPAEQPRADQRDRAAGQRLQPAARVDEPSARRRRRRGSRAIRARRRRPAGASLPDRRAAPAARSRTGNRRCARCG